jgi:putative flippase GtrA
LISEPLLTRIYRFVRASIVGSGASVLDFLVLTTGIRVFGLAPTVARLPALLVGASVQFFGSRGFAFRARAGNISTQAKLFVCAETISVALNWAVFRWLVPRITVLPPEIVSFMGTFLVFVTFNYPVRRLVVFKVDASADATPGAGH